MNPEYGTGQISSHIQELLFNGFVVSFLHRLKNRNML